MGTIPGGPRRRRGHREAAIGCHLMLRCGCWPSPRCIWRAIRPAVHHLSRTGPSLLRVPIAQRDTQAVFRSCHEARERADAISTRPVLLWYAEFPGRSAVPWETDTGEVATDLWPPEPSAPGCANARVAAFAQRRSVCYDQCNRLDHHGHCWRMSYGRRGVMTFAGRPRALAENSP